MLQRKAWNQDEDKALRELYQDRKIRKWAQLSRLLQSQYLIFGRSGKQCRQRYNNHLDRTVRHQKWSYEEDKLLVTLHNAQGNRWAQISRTITGRSQNCVKNQLYSILRRGLRKINMIIRTKLKRFKQLQIGVIYKLVEICEFVYKRKECPKQMTELVNMKKQIIDYGMTVSDLIDDEEVLKVKDLIGRIKSFCKKGDKQLRWESIQQQQSVSSEELRDKCQFGGVINKEKKGVIQKIYIQKSLQEDEKSETNSSLSVDRVSVDRVSVDRVPVDKGMNKKERSKSNLSGQLLCHGIFESFDIQQSQRFFQFPEYDILASPRPLICLQSPYFDQLRDSFSNWDNNMPN